MPFKTFEKIGRLHLQPSNDIVKLADGSKTQVNGMIKYVQVKVEFFSFPTYMTIMEMTDYQECPLLLVRSFLPTSQALIDVEKGKIVIRSNGDSQTYNVSANIDGTLSNETYKMARVRYSQRTTTLKRHKVKQTNESNEEMGDKTRI